MKEEHSTTKYLAVMLGFMFFLAAGEIALFAISGMSASKKDIEDLQKAFMQGQQVDLALVSATNKLTRKIFGEPTPKPTAPAQPKTMYDYVYPSPNIWEPGGSNK